MKKKLYISSIIVAAIISTLLMLLPYKRYDQVGFLFSSGVTPNVTTSILDHLHDGFGGNYFELVFLAIFFPVLILPELSLSCRHNRIKFLLPIQALLLLGAGFVMTIAMTLNLFEINTKLLPAFYATMVWVSASAILSFLLFFKKIRNSVGTFFNIQARPKQLELI